MVRFCGGLYAFSENLTILFNLERFRYCLEGGEYMVIVLYNYLMIVVV